MKKTKRGLSLTKETLRALQLGRVRGGFIPIKNNQLACGLDSDPDTQAQQVTLQCDTITCTCPNKTCHCSIPQAQ